MRGYLFASKIILAIAFVVWVTVPISTQAQTSRIVARKAYKAYNKKEYARSLDLYKQSLRFSKPDPRSNFGKANSLLRLGKDKEALELLTSMLDSTATQQTAREIADIAHNIGNIHMAHKDYAQAIDAYKQSLKAFPGDPETIYNLALALKLQQKTPPQGGGGGGSSQNSQDNKQSNSPQKEDKDQRDSSAEKTKNDDNHGKIDKEQAEKILDSFRKKEEETRKKVEKKKGENENKNQKTKNW